MLSVVFVGDVIGDLVDIVGLIGEIGLEFLAAALDALFKAFTKASFLEMVQHQIFHIVPKAFLHHFVDAFVAEDGKLSVLDGQIDEHAVAELGLVEFQVVEDLKAPFFHITPTVVFDMHLDLARGVELGLFDGLYDAAVFFPVQYGDGVRHNLGI